MRRILSAVMSVAAIVACGSESTEPGKKAPALDPYVTVRVRNQLDTTTRPGRADWRVYVLLTGPQANQNGIANQGNLSLTDIRLGRARRCMSIGADSIGQRLISPFAIADTTTEASTPVARTDSIVARWYAGNHAPATGGIMVIAIAPTDAWDSPQFTAGHGLTMTDPIKWTWDWSGSGTSVFAERAATDTTGGCNTF